MNKIKLPKLHYACCSDRLRLTIEHILVTKDEVVATDGNILVVHKTSDIFDSDFISNMPERFLIHRTQWRLFCSNARIISFENNSICVVYDGYKVNYQISTEEEIGLKYPNYNSVFPKKEEVEAIDSIGLNPIKLHNLSQAMFASVSSSKGLKFAFYGKARGVLVTPSDMYNNTRALIMPVMIN